MRYIALMILYQLKNLLVSEKLKKHLLAFIRDDDRTLRSAAMRLLLNRMTKSDVVEVVDSLKNLIKSSIIELKEKETISDLIVDNIANRFQSQIGDDRIWILELYFFISNIASKRGQNSLSVAISAFLLRFPDLLSIAQGKLDDYTQLNAFSLSIISVLLEKR